MPPKLPTAEDLGFSNFQTGRGQASVNASPLAEGAAVFAKGVQNLGGGIIDISEKQAKQADSLEEAQARADLTVASANRKSAIADALDPTDLDKTHAEGAQQDLEKAAERISDPAKRALFMEAARPTVNSLGLAAKDRQDALKGDAAKAGALTQLETLKKTAVTSNDPAIREQAIRDGSAILEGLHKEGYTTAEETARQTQQWQRSYAYDALTQMNPNAQLAAVRGGWEGALINRESSGNPRILNQFGYAGLYQMGAPLLSTLGVYKPGADENLSNWKDTDKNAPGKWTGTFNIPGFPGVRTIADFRENPEAQRAAFQASQTYYDGEIVRRGLDKFIGKTVGGVPITREGIYSMMHLGGAAGADTALRGGGNAADANGSTVLGYARMAANAGPGAGLSKYLSAEQMASVANAATRDLVQQDRQAQQAQANEVSTVKSLMKDDETSISFQGAPVAELTRKRVEDAMGPAAADAFEQNRAAAVRYHDAAHDFEAIPMSDIRTRVASLAPVPGAPGFDNAQKYYDVAVKEATAIQKERQTDPAAAADRLPAVKEALQGASLDRPNSYQPVAKARAIAQDRLGIPEDLRVPMTRAEAQQVAKPLQLAGESGDGATIRSTVTDTVKQLKEAFGDDADTAFQQVLREAHLGRQNDELAAMVYKKLARSEGLTRQDARAVDEAGRTSAADRAVAAVAPQSAASLPLNFDPTLGATGADYLNPQAAPAAAPTFPTPDDGAIDMLRKKPELASAFNRTYGPGAAERVQQITGGARR